MNALKVLFMISIVLYLTIYEPSYWKYFFAILIPYYILTQIIFFNSKLNTPKRKTFISLWSHPSDPQIFARIKVEISKVDEFLDQYSQKIGNKISYLSFFVKVFSIMLSRYPKINGTINFGKVLKFFYFSLFQDPQMI